MRLLYLANAASVHTRRWVNFFARAGHEVHLVTWHEAAEGDEFESSVHVHRVLFPPHYALRYAALLRVMDIVRKVKPDLVHAHYLGHFGIIAGLLQRVTDFRPVVLTAWGSDVLIEARGWKRRLMSDALSRADCVTCDARHMVGELVKLGAPDERITVVYHGTDTVQFKPGLRNPQFAGTSGRQDCPVVISLRALKPLYDVESLIRAVPLVLKEVCEAKFVIAGNGDQKEYLERLATELGIAGNVRFIGFIENEQLPKYLTSSDIYVSTSLSDAGLSASTSEAMACGLPVVVTDFGDNGEWVEDGVNGYLFPPGDVEALASRLVDLLGDPGKRRRFGEAGTKVIVERNSYEVEMSKMEQIYVELIGRHRR